MHMRFQTIFFMVISAIAKIRLVLFERVIFNSNVPINWSGEKSTENNKVKII